MRQIDNGLISGFLSIAVAMLIIGVALGVVASLYGFFIGVAIFVIRTIGGF